MIHIPEIHPEITRAKTLPGSFYTSGELFEKSKEQIFSRSWQVVANTAQIQVPGTLYPHTLFEGFLDEPLLLLRDKDDEIRCMSNVCTHRGAILVEHPCSLQQIRCRYHGRRFDLQGVCRFMPEFEGVVDFPAESDHLTQIPHYRWDPWMFVSLNPAIPAETILQPVMERLLWLSMNFSELVFEPTLSRDYLVRAHWALYCENYLEGFHIPFVHASLNEALDYGAYTTELFPYCNLQLGIAKSGDVCFELPKGSPDYGKQVAAYYFWVFPNLMINVYPWGISLNIVRPITPDRTKVSFLTYLYDRNLYNIGAGSDLDRVEREDESIVESVQNGIRSRFYRYGRYSPKRETGTHHFHRLLEAWMKNEFEI